MLEDRTFGDAQFVGHVTDTSRLEAMLGKMLHSDFDDAGPLGLAAGTRGAFPVL
jgi:hypothetical protein